MSEQSCFNCAHVHAWNHPQTLTDPADSGWECNHPKIGELPYVDPPDDVLTDDQKYASYCADGCPGYEFKDWGTDESEPGWESQLPTEEEILQWRELTQRTLLLSLLGLNNNQSGNHENN